MKTPRVVIVPSPLVMAFAYGAAAAIWQKNGAATFAAYDAIDATFAAIAAATDAAIDDATYDATRAAIAAIYDATFAATVAATDATYDAIVATRVATRNATRVAIDAATDATRAATRSAIDDATATAIDDATRVAIDAIDDATFAATFAAAYDATYNATVAATRAATYDESHAASACYALAGDAGIKAARQWSNVYQGGNMWASYDCYLTAARDILGLRLPQHDSYAHWEQAAIHGGFRVMHPEFCMVSDFPEVLKIDDQNLPHCEDGPSHRWRDGWSLYHWHGVRIPAEWIENKSSLSAKTALTWENVEQRRAACEIVGWDRILQELDAKVIDTDEDEMIGQLVEVILPDIGREKFLRVKCGTGRRFALPVPPDMQTALQANSWTYGVDTQVLRALEART